MAANPNRYDHDDVHGPALIQQQRLANSMTEVKELPTSEDIEQIFMKQASEKEGEYCAVGGNQNPGDELHPKRF